MKIDNIQYEYSEGFHQITAFFDTGYELAMNLVEDNPHAIGAYTYSIDWMEPQRDGAPIIDESVKTKYESFAEEVKKKGEAHIKSLSAA